MALAMLSAFSWGEFSWGVVNSIIAILIGL